jgi:hypothetical protein
MSLAIQLHRRRIGDMTLSLKTLKYTTVTLLANFVVFTSAVLYLAFNVPELKILSPYDESAQIFVSGNYDLSQREEIAGGSGTEDDPYVIEWTAFVLSSGAGISMNDTNTHVAIRNCWFTSTYSSRAAGGIPSGVWLSNASHVRIESSMFSHLSVGIRIDGKSVEDSTDLRISRCVFSSCRIGVLASNLSDFDVEYCCMPYSSERSVSIADCSESAITGNRIDQSGGIGVFNCTSASVCENDLYYCAIEMRDSKNLLVSNNTVYSGSSTPGIKVVRSGMVTAVDNALLHGGTIHFNQSDRCEISRNVLRGGQDWGGQRVSITASFLSNSTITGNSLDGLGGLWLWWVRGCTVSGNTILNSTVSTWSGSSDHGSGIYARGTDTLVSGNYVRWGDCGITVIGDNLTVMGNIVRDIDIGTYGSGGIDAGSCRDLSVVDNTISNISGYFVYDTFGITLSGSSRVSIARNSITDGAYVSDVNNATICDNLFTGPAQLYCSWYRTPPTNLTLHGNSFLDMTVRFPSSPIVSLNVEYPVGGNYWSAYDSVDLYSGPDQDILGADGIGDEPYQVTSVDTDHYPLMQQTVREDLSAPLTYAVISGTTGSMGWFRSNLTVTLWSDDGGSGVEDTCYRLDDGQWQEYTGPVPVVGEDTHTIEFYSVDEAGNSEGASRRDLRIDSLPPMPVLGIQTEYAFSDSTAGVIRVEFTDDLSGISDVWAGTSSEPYSYSYNDKVPVPNLQVSLHDGASTVYAWARDRAGNVAGLTISIESSINYDREPLSLSGPYGPFLVLAVVSDLVLLVLLVIASEKLRGFGSVRKWKKTDKESWERDKVYDVEDGYTKYIKKQ